MQIQFGLDQTLAGNEAQVILNQIKLGILSDRKNSKRKATNDDTGKDDTDALTSPIEKVTATLQRNSISVFAIVYIFTLNFCIFVG